MTEKIKSKIRRIQDWPKEGIMFHDITTLLKDAPEFNRTIELLLERYKDKTIDVVAGIESRGFIIGSILAHRLDVGFIPLHKKGKLPAETESEEYEVHYGKETLEMHKDAIMNGQKVLIVDDLIASGNTAMAACKLIKKAGGELVECCFIIDLPDLGGKKKLEKAGYPVFSLVEFEGE
ncbi:MAG: adenine phosphoribosyltransferase [Candidatus Woesearchaeota archaeon]